MNAEIIAVGTEILTGQIVNTNAQFISEKMAEIGVDVYYQTAVGDNEKRLLEVIDTASKRSELIILTGGLGPTEDDLTKQTLAKFLGKSLVFDQQAKDKLDQFFASRSKTSRTPNNERQAQIIEGSIPIQNITGLAVGGLLVDGEKTYVVLPGPPSELKPMVTKHLVPLLSKGNEILYSKVLRFFGIGESQLVTVLSEYIKDQTDPTIAPYAKTGEVTLRLSTKSNSEQEANEKLDSLEKELLSVRSLDKTPLSEYMYGYGEDNSLAKVVFENILNRKLTISAAESLTAGMFQAKLADFSGSSQLFKGGYVTYSIEEKTRMLGIPLADLQEHGVVSHFTAQQMALKSRQLTQSDIGVGLTGVAGPGELEGHPAGTVYIGISTTEKTESIQVSIGGRSRSDIRYIAMMHAFNLVRKTLL
ncbi:damage-inducible protein CinA [Streptococcus penaeicida]|uniref:Putative competence-damage inducible protein n=1 Tax=Streptococcus penaeicida TaxID=1765960 RepID=A0A2N8LA13_9STRE|nr:competence/damage-inducible protein A [Streptococcus penaeicida]PND47007.1 damage-inducible protein CinA [Streptococcus penaeicida]